MRHNHSGKLPACPSSVTAAIIALAAVFFVPGALFASGTLEVTKVSRSSAKPITFPPSGITFNHKFHAETVGATCDVCHQTSDTSSRFMTFPNHDTCGACHADAIDETSAQKNCALCHNQPGYKTNLPKNVAFFSNVSSFDHKLHLDKNVSCESCHTATNFTAGKANETLPNMDTCVACHTKFNAKAASDCSVCHVKGYDTTRPADHGPLWVTNHGRGLTQAQIDSRCNLCHTVQNGDDCLTCHKRSSPPLSHTLAWQLQGHGVAAETNRQTCTVCHDQAECISCHTTNEPFSHTGLWGSPSDRHCLYCHLDSTNYVSGTVGSDCSFCHQASNVFAKHMSLPMIGHNTGSDCTTCHSLTAGVGPAIQHPYPPVAAQCVVCHQ